MAFKFPSINVSLNRLSSLIAYTALIVVTIVAVNVLIIAQFHQTTLRDAQAGLLRQSLTLSELVERTLQSIDLVVASVAEKVQLTALADRDPSLLETHDYHVFLKEKMAGLPQIDALGLIDAAGVTLNTTRQWPNPRYDLSTREYFQALKNNPQVAHFIGEPLQNKSSGAWVISFVRPVTGADGNLFSVVFVSTTLAHFEEMFRATSLGDGYAATLMRSDGTLLARFPSAGQVGKVAPVSVLKTMQGSRSGVSRSVSPVDNQARIAAGYRLANYPLVVVTTQSEETVFAVWRKRAAVLSGFVAAMILMIVIAACLVARSWSQQDRLGAARAKIIEAEKNSALMQAELGRQRDLAAQNARFNAAVENLSQGLVMFDASARLIVCNQRYLDMYGLSPDIVKPGCALLDLLNHRAAVGTFPAEAIGSYMAELKEALDQGTTVRRITSLGDGRIVSVVNQSIASGGWVATHEDVTIQKRAEERIAYAAHHDILTGLPNRATFNDAMDATIERAARTGDPFAVMSIDLDRFKEANDNYGHLIGDALLGAVAGRMQTAAEGAFIARIGGDEFAAISVGSDQPAAAEVLAERLLGVFAEDFVVEGHQLKLGMSIGIAIYPTDGTGVQALMANADAALYRAKAETRGAALLFEPEMSATLRDRHALQQDLRSAIGRGELLLNYQPQFRMTGEAIGFEALVRWRCPKRGMVSPATFIPIAEESSLIIQLGEWVLREACREAASWSRPLTVAVNISPVQFREGDLPRLVHSILLETGLAPGRLELEITESVMINDLSRAVSILNRLKTLGIKIALDDFGTGYSSLSYLQAFRFDKVKIDRAFIADLETDYNSRAIVHAVIGLGQSLDLPILAEGVETAAQHAYLLGEGCDAVQGYLTGRPQPIVDYSELVGRADVVRRKRAVAG